MLDKELVISMRLQGLGFANIGRQLGVSRQRVEQVTKTLAKQRQMPNLMFPSKGYVNGLKKCTICKQYLPLLNFGHSRSEWDGLSSRCRDCNTLLGRKFLKNHPGYAEARQLKYAKLHPDRLRAWARANYKYKTPQTCEIPGCPNLGIRHHLDYDHDIIKFLCPTHHRLLHLGRLTL